MRVVFLGNGYNPLSIACLQALLAGPQPEVMVGIGSPTRRGLVRSVLGVYWRHGPAFLLRRARDLLVARTRLLFRRLGVDFSGYGSLLELVAEENVPSFVVEDVNSDDSIARIKKVRPDLIVVAAFSQILGPSVLSVPSRGAINVHPSLLPRFRGPNPYYWILETGEETSGVTVHHMDEGIDSGDIIAQEKFFLPSDATESWLQKRSAEVGAKLVVEVVRLLEEGRVDAIPQDEAEATYFGHPPRGQCRL